ncbi:phBC6A51 family helix-turn-helix protein [Lederbergia citri]|uniref:Homeodomain phBC6A51-type domain-containing protein n=1 Tax=Lederbergia citri TaxID=2833580 RepID=A0A942YGG5_9BACI|nr:phBC6A51 family helix-turn-helix protein [Lederbergia citri]MBS4193491.1 hypothetical protein [Lederbergia citri]
MTKRLNEKQIAAITILAQPKRGGLTYEEVAEQVGVARSTLYEWKKSDLFNEALKREVVRNTLDRLPEVLESVPDHIIKDGNAAMLRTYLQMHDLLSDKLEIDNKASTESTSDLDAMKAEIARMRNERKALE